MFAIEPMAEEAAVTEPQSPGEIISRYAEGIATRDSMAGQIRKALLKRLSSSTFRVLVAYDLLRQGFDVKLQLQGKPEVADNWLIADEDLDANCSSTASFNEFIDSQVEAFQALRGPAPTTKPNTANGWYEATGRVVGPLSDSTANQLGSANGGEQGLTQVLDLRQHMREQARLEKDRQAAIASITETAQHLLAGSDGRPESDET
jgi:hypothetical protein